MIDYEEQYSGNEPQEQMDVNEDVEETVEVEETETTEEDQEFTQMLYPQAKPGKANIVVVGVGGGGNNAVNNMVKAGITSANFLVMNTDMQALNMSRVSPQCKIQLGAKKTGGLGAGSDPELGREAAEESREIIKKALQGVNLLFITAGMGGGTGTGAAPVIAEIAKGMGILTVAVVTKPFNFEGQLRMRNAEEGIKNLQKFVDTLLVIPNQKLIEVLGKDISFKRAFEIADDRLRQAIQGVSDVIANPSHINLDFADVRTILYNKGLAHMGIGFGKGEQRVLDAVRTAVFSPLLETNIEGATGVILNIVGGEDMLLSEVTEACDLIKQVVAPNANIIFGTAFLPDKKDIQITIIATGFVDKNAMPARQPGTNPAPTFKSINSTFGPFKGTDEMKPEYQNLQNVEEPIKEQQDDVKEDMFSNRPRFNTYQPQEQRPREMYGQEPQAPARELYTQEARPQAPQYANRVEQQQPTHEDNHAGHGLPEFLRRLRGGRN